MLRKILSTVDKPRYVEGGKFQRLSLVEFRIMKCSKTNDPVDQSWR
ncbi:hypothetical protein [Rubritalea tangerina]